MQRKFFGTDGIRGRVGEKPLTPDFLVRLGFAAGKMLGAGEVLVGKDTRRSCYMVESALEAGLSAAGADVLLSGPLPTSAVSYLTPALRLSAGIVISASHNPHTDNGVKFFDSRGGKLSDADEAKIERLLQNARDINFAGQPGRARHLKTAGADRYIEFCKRAFPITMNLRGLRLVADCANGAAYRIAPPVFHELGADVFAIGDKPDGENINVKCGALAPQAAQAEVLRAGADAGIVLDGDADRVLLVDEKGKLHNGDALLYLIARRARSRGKPLAGVVGTILSNLALEKSLAKMQTKFFRAEVGDRYVNEAMRERGWRAGGEASGHIILRDFHQTGDGIIAALQALRAMVEEGAPLSELFAEYAPLPQAAVNVAVKNKTAALQNAKVKKALKEARRELGGDARLIARPSGTENLIRLMAEGEDEKLLRAALARVKEAFE